MKKEKEEEEGKEEEKDDDDEEVENVGMYGCNVSLSAVAAAVLPRMPRGRRHSTR